MRAEVFVHHPQVFVLGNDAVVGRFLLFELLSEDADHEGRAAGGYFLNHGDILLLAYYHRSSSQILLGATPASASSASPMRLSQGSACLPQG